MYIIVRRARFVLGVPIARASKRTEAYFVACRVVSRLSLATETSTFDPFRFPSSSTRKQEGNCDNVVEIK